jgi:multidrug efflux pump subunit AcrA (membrane-fusion protein)
MTQPYTFPEAVAAARRAAESQRAGEQAVRDAAEQAAEAERQYRRALAQQIVTVHAEGAAWTVAQDLARGAQHVADLRYARDVQAGVLEAAQQRAWRHSADRKDMVQFIEWSKRRDLSEGHGEPQWAQEGQA